MINSQISLRLVPPPEIDVQRNRSPDKDTISFCWCSTNNAVLRDDITRKFKIVPIYYSCSKTSNAWSNVNPKHFWWSLFLFSSEWWQSPTILMLEEFVIPDEKQKLWYTMMMAQRNFRWFHTWQRHKILMLTKLVMSDDKTTSHSRWFQNLTQTENTDVCRISDAW